MNKRSPAPLKQREADPDGLEPAEAEALSNALLRAFGQNEEYPCLLEDPAPRNNMIPVGGPGDPDLVAIPPLGGTRLGRGENDPALGRDPIALAARLLVEAYLTPRQRQVARLMLRGWKPKEIASKLGIAASTVRKLWSRARKPLGEALVKLALSRAQEEEERPPSSAEIREIYLEEVGRYGYHQPQHCAAGKERCKRSGVCEFALPMAYLVGTAGDRE